MSGNDTYNSRFRGIARESVFQCILCAGLCQVVKVFYEYFVCSYDLCLAFFRGCQDKVKDACLCVFLQVWSSGLFSKGKMSMENLVQSQHIFFPWNGICLCHVQLTSFSARSFSLTSFTVTLDAQIILAYLGEFERQALFPKSQDTEDFPTLL